MYLTFPAPIPEQVVENDGTKDRNCQPLSPIEARYVK